MAAGSVAQFMKDGTSGELAALAKLERAFSKAHEGFSLEDGLGGGARVSMPRPPCG